MCIELDLIAGNVLFVDGTKIRANASISNSYTKETAKKVLANIDKRIDKLIVRCEQADADEEGQSSFAKLSKGLENANKLKSRIESIAEQLNKKGALSSINTVNPDCSRMHGRQGSHAGFNGQIVVDEKNGLIVSCDAVSENNDLGQLSNQMQQANEVVDGKLKIACVDAGQLGIVIMTKWLSLLKRISRLSFRHLSKRHNTIPVNARECSFNCVNGLNDLRQITLLP